MPITSIITCTKCGFKHTLLTSNIQWQKIMNGEPLFCYKCNDYVQHNIKQESKEKSKDSESAKSLIDKISTKE